MQSKKKTAPLILKVITPCFFEKKTINNPLSEDKRPVFLLSTGRTGTTFLAEYLNRSAEVTAVHEPKPSRILRMWSMAYLEGKVHDKFMTQVLAKKRKKLLSNIDTPIYVESNPFLSGFPTAINTLFPNAIIIHITRDPFEYARSSMNHGNAFGLKLFFNTYVPFWYAKVEKILGIHSKLSMKLKAAGYWTVVNEELMQLDQGNPNYLRIKFEDLFQEGNKGLKEVCKIIGIKYVKPNSHSKSVNKSRYNVVGQKQGWTKAELSMVKKLCGPLMKKLDY